MTRQIGQSRKEANTRSLTRYRSLLERRAGRYGTGRTGLRTLRNWSTLINPINTRQKVSASSRERTRPVRPDRELYNLWKDPGKNKGACSALSYDLQFDFSDSDR